MWPRDTDGDGATDSAWVVMAYEETKALGTGIDEDDVEPIDIGKNIWYHSFDMFAPDIVAQGGILNQPAVDRETGLFFEMVVDEWGNSFYETEIARRFSLVSQPVENVGDSGHGGLCPLQAGDHQPGRPGRHLRPPLRSAGGFRSRHRQPLRLREHGVRQLGSSTTAATPLTCRACCLDPTVNVSGTTIISCDNGSGGRRLRRHLPLGRRYADFPKVTEWRFCDGSSGVDGCDDSNLDDQSWDNPFDVAKGHRGFIDGDFVMVLYAWSPNWKANSVGNDHYNLYVRRSFDGGETLTTTPADLGGTGTTFEEYYYGASPAMSFPWSTRLGPASSSRRATCRS